MTTADKIAVALRKIAPAGRLLAADVPLIDKLAANWDARAPQDTPSDPPWIIAARAKLGQREIKGPRHNAWIAKGWARLGAGWFNDDETPWCGFFVADCLNAAGLPYPKNFPAASSFRAYGVNSPAQLGAIGVKARRGGNHVFFIVGITADGKFYKALGGNQSDMVNIVDMPISQVDAIRWPSGYPMPSAAMRVLPIMARGTSAGREA